MADPLHLKNNTIKERFMILFKIVLAESRLESVKSFKDVPDNSLLQTFVSFVRKEMNRNFLAKKIHGLMKMVGNKRRNLFSDLGEKKVFYRKHFPSLIKMLISSILNTDIPKRLIEVHLQSIYLHQLLLYTVCITNFNLDDLDFMKKVGKKLFKSCCICYNKISPSLWTLCNVVPIHAEVFFRL